MIVIIALYLQSIVQSALITVASGEFITVRDRDFTGADKRLGRLLAQRIDPPIDLTIGFSTNATLFLPDMELPSAAAAYNSSRYNVSQFLESGRRQQDIYFTNYYVQVKILDLMRQAIYQSRYRLKGIERVLQKYQKDERFRISFIFAKLDQWQREIRGIHQAALFNLENMPVSKHIFYYEHCLRRHVDVTYSLQFLYTLHHNFMLQWRQIMYGGGSGEFSARDVKSGKKAEYIKERKQERLDRRKKRLEKEKKLMDKNKNG